MTRYLVAVATCLLLWLAIGATKAAAEDASPEEQSQSEVEAAEAGEQAEAQDEAPSKDSEQVEGTDESGSESGPPTQESCDDCNGDWGADEATGEEEREPEPEPEKQPVVNFKVSVQPHVPGVSGTGQVPTPIVAEGEGGQPIVPLQATPIVPLPNQPGVLGQTGGGPGGLLAEAQGVNLPAVPNDPPSCAACQSGSGEPDAIVEEEDDRDRLSGRRRCRCGRTSRSRGFRARGDTAQHQLGPVLHDTSPAGGAPHPASDPAVQGWPPGGKDEQEFGPAWASAEARRAGLTDREWDVLSALVTGDSTREIARKLYISPRTVTNHLIHIYDKLGARSRAKVLACVLGLFPDRPAQ